MVDARARECLIFFEVGVCTVIGSCSISICGLWDVVSLTAVDLLLLSSVGVTHVLMILCKVVLDVVKMRV